MDVISNGNINATYDVSIEHGGKVRRFVFQKLNIFVFKNPKKIMKNIEAITSHIADKLEADGKSRDCVMHFAHTIEGKNYFMEDQGFWRIVEGKDCTPEQAQIRELFSGVMVFNSRALFRILPEVGCANVQKEYYVTEVPELMAKHGLKVETYFTKDGDDLRGINTPEDLEMCERILEQRGAALLR